jgi:hypothetical protein
MPYYQALMRPQAMAYWNELGMDYWNKQLQAATPPINAEKDKKRQTQPDIVLSVQCFQTHCFFIASSLEQ